MFKKLTIKGFRGIKHIDIEDFQKVNLFVGRNNCGKTSILESLFLLIGPTNPELTVRINSFRNFLNLDENFWRFFFNKLNTNSIIELSGDLINPKEKRCIKIKPIMKSSTLTSLNKRIINEKSIDINGSYTGLSTKIDGLTLNFSINENHHHEIISEIVVRGTKIETKLPKSYAESLKGVFINPKTINLDLGARFSNIQISKRLDRIIKTLQQIEPALENLSLGNDGLIYCDIGLEKFLPINVLGDGIFRLLSIIMAISDTQDGVVLIDEIENGFHFTSQEILWNAIFSTAKEFNVQIFATTHSYECVKALGAVYSKITYNIHDYLRLFRIERKDDKFKTIRYDADTLKASLESDWEVR